MRTGEIKALSGLRIVAAVWVVLFHFRPWLEVSAPGFRSALAPVINCGAQGVDLFFILSGFVLTWNYLDRMGESFSMKATLHFLWLRLARVWPVYVVTLHLALAWIIFTLYVGHLPSPVADQLSAVSYARQVLLVQLWFQPFFDGSSWDGPAWSISAEWLAYLLFGVVVLAIFRIARATRVRGLLWLAFAACCRRRCCCFRPALLHTVELASADRHAVHRGRAGCAAVRKLQLSDRARRGAGYLSVVLCAAIVGILYFLDAYPLAKVYDSSGLVDVLFVPLVVTLAIGIGSLPRAAVHPSDGVLRTHLVQPVHGARIGAHGLELDHGAIRDRPHAELVGEADSGWCVRGRLRRCRAAVPLRRGARPHLDAQMVKVATASSRYAGVARRRPRRGARSGTRQAPTHPRPPPSPCKRRHRPRGLTDGTDPNSAARDDIAAIL